MTEHELRYDRMVEEALLGVVRRALNAVAEHGLPGNHHFYITFRTDHPDVVLPDHLRQRYPGEMTIVLQHQFWGLEVEEESFQVTLSFNDVPENLVVPFQAVVAFADPSVRFGLQFDVEDGDEEQEEEEGQDLLAGLAEDGTPQDGAAVKSGKGDAKGDDAAAEEDRSDDGESKVVTLDAFRKK